MVFSIYIQIYIKCFVSNSFDTFRLSRVGSCVTKCYINFITFPGFCLKTKDEKGGKVFINVCHADSVSLSMFALHSWYL